MVTPMLAGGGVYEVPTVDVCAVGLPAAANSTNRSPKAIGVQVKLG